MTEQDKRAQQELDKIKANIALNLESPPYQVRVGNAILDTLEAFLGVREIGTTNKGFWIDKFHAQIGLRPGYPWCMMFLQYVYRFVSAAFGIKDLLPFNTAGTKAFGDWAEKNGLTRKSFADVSEGDLIVWQNGKGPEGHVGAITSVSTANGNIYHISTIEGNTSSKDYRDGGQIAEKAYDYAPAELGARRPDLRWLRCIVSFDALYELSTGEKA